MLIRVRGGVEGVADYLENGRKEGRDKHRDELDERVVLAGDLAATDRLIESMDGEGDRYKHITLAFKEDAIAPENLRAVVEDFRKFLLSAFREDEVCFYAEAHLPRLKSYIDRKTGDVVERKPHVHIVVPMVNLLSWKRADPVGFYEQSERFFEAFQEHANKKYGFASPKENRRTVFTDESEMISRYKGDGFGGERKGIKGELLRAMLDENVNTLGDFGALLKRFGEVKVRNEGRENAYFNVKQSGARKGVNLKDFVFSREFIEAPIERKRELLTSEKIKYESVGVPERTPEKYSALLDQWHALRAREIKYINSGNKPFYKKYAAMAPEGKIGILSERESSFYERYGGSYEQNRKRSTQLDRGVPPPRARRGLRHMSTLPVVGGEGHDSKREGHKGDRAVLLPTDVQHHVEHREADRSGGLRRPNGGGRRGIGLSNSVLGQLDREAQAREAERKFGDVEEFAQIRRELDPARLLAHVSKTHGVIPSKFPMATAKDGSPRIQCGTRSRTVSDFLTKELNLPWAEASGILREVFAAQQQHVVARPAALPRQDLWRSFQAWQMTEVPKLKQAELERLRKDRDAALQSAKSQLNASRSMIDGDRSLSKTDRQVARAVAKAAHVHGAKGARDAFKGYSAEADRRWSTHGDRLYTLFLATLAQQEPVVADAAFAELARREKELETLSELRRTRAIAKRDAEKAYADVSAQLHGDTGLSPSERQERLVSARVQCDQAVKTAQDVYMAESAAVLQRWSSSPDCLHPQTFATPVPEGSVLGNAALAELRRRRPDLAELDDAAGCFIRADREQAEQDGDSIRRVTLLTFSHRVDLQGRVTYQLGGRDILRDEGNRLQVLQERDPDVIAEGLLIARSKFGQRLTLTGSAEFQLRVVQVAVQQGINVEFVDPGLQVVHQQLQAKASERDRLAALGRAAIDLERKKAKDVAAPLPKTPDITMPPVEKAPSPAPVEPHRMPAPAAVPVAEPIVSVASTLFEQSHEARHDVPHRGRVVARDATYVFQQTKVGLVRHVQAAFDKAPELQEDVVIRYRSGRALAKPIERSKGR